MATEAWNDYFVAQAGASAALAGLIFVAISISLDDLIKYPSQLDRAAAALALLVTVLVTSGLALAPGQPRWAVGAEILAAGLLSCGISTGFGLRSVRRAEATYRANSAWSLVLYPTATLPIIVAGLWVLVGGADGLHWLLPGFVMAVVVAVVDAWVLLVAVHR